MKKVAIITGASSGLGRQFVIQTAKSHGFLDEIWVVARRADRLFELGVLVSNIVIRPIPLDLAKKDSAERIRNILAKEKPKVYVLVNCSGLGLADGESELSRSHEDHQSRAAVYAKKGTYRTSGIFCGICTSAGICSLCGDKVLCTESEPGIETGAEKERNYCDGRLSGTGKDRVL